jgi:hypothetical protein
MNNNQTVILSTEYSLSAKEVELIKDSWAQHGYKVTSIALSRAPEDESRGGFLVPTCHDVKRPGRQAAFWRWLYRRTGIERFYRRGMITVKFELQKEIALSDPNVMHIRKPKGRFLVDIQKEEDDDPPTD